MVSAFIAGIDDLSSNFRDPAVHKIFNKIVTTLSELVKQQATLTDQIQRTIGRNLVNFCRNDLLPVKETKRHFDKISDELDTILQRNSQASRSKPQESEDVGNLLTATRSCFQHMSLDYVSQLSCLQSRKRHEILDAVRFSSLSARKMLISHSCHCGSGIFCTYSSYAVYCKHKARIRDMDSKCTPAWRSLSQRLKLR